MGLRRILGIRSRERRRASTDIDALIAKGDLDRAETQLRTRVQANPDSLGYRVKLADLFARNNKPTRAAIEYMSVADAHTRKEAYDPAIRLAKKALELSPGNLEMTTRLVQLERLRQAQSKRSVIFDHLEHGERPAGSRQRMTSARLLEFWPEIVPSAFVQELPAERLGAFFVSVEPIQAGHHMAVMRQGQIIARGHLLVSGEIEATVPAPDGRQRRLRVLKPGEFFGEASLLDNAECPANYRALGDDTLVLRLTKRALDGLLASDPGAGDLIAAFRSFGCDGAVYALARGLKDQEGGNDS